MKLINSAKGLKQFRIIAAIPIFVLTTIASNCFCQADTNLVPTSKAVLKYYFEQTEKAQVLANDTLLKSKQINILQNTIIQYQKDSANCVESKKISSEKQAVAALVIESKNAEIKTLGKKVSAFKFTTIISWIVGALSTGYFVFN